MPAPPRRCRAETPVPERREARTRFRLFRQIEFRCNHALTLVQARQHLAPVIDDQRVAISFASARVRAALRRRRHVAQILDRARAQQRFPVRAPGRHGER